MKKDDYIQRRNDHWKEIFPDLRLEGVWGRVVRLARRHSLQCGKIMQPFGLRSVEADVLAALLHSDPPYALTPKEITFHCARTPGAITGILDSLESRGLITREINASNRRSYTVTLTKMGVDLARESFLTQVHTEQQMLQVLTTREKQELAALLKKILVDMEEKDPL